MKKFKLVFWSDCRGMDIDSESVMEFKSSKEVLEYLIGEKVGDESWVDYVNNVLNLGSSDIDWVEDKSKWEDMFVLGSLENSIFEVDFCNELNSCVVVREDSELFNKEWDCEMVNDLI